MSTWHFLASCMPCLVGFELSIFPSATAQSLRGDCIAGFLLLAPSHDFLCNRFPH